MGNQTFNSGDGERGPSWFDVYKLLQLLRAESGRDVCIQIRPVRGLTGNWGLRVTVHDGERSREYWNGFYGKGSMGGMATLASACWRACFNAYHDDSPNSVIRRDDSDPSATGDKRAA